MKKAFFSPKPYASPLVQVQVCHLELGLLTETATVDKAHEDPIDLDD